MPTSLSPSAMLQHRATNVGTCAAYIVAGGLTSSDDPARMAFALWMIVLGLTSAWYHATDWSLRTLRSDQFGMYGTFVALSLHAATDHQWAWLFMVGAGVVVGYMYAFRPDREVVVGMTILQPMMIMLGGLTATLVLLNGTPWYSGAAFALFGIAWLAWHQEWGHGVWHVLTAAAIWFLYAGVR